MFDARDVLEDERYTEDRDRDRPIQLAAQECAEQTAKIEALLAQLERRLEPARRPNKRDDPDANVPNEVAAISSPLANDLGKTARRIKRLQHRVGTLLEELEV